MKALSLLSLLLALLIVAVLARKQLSVTKPNSPTAAALAASNTGVELPKVDGAADARLVEQRVQDDVNRMMQDSASQVERGVEAVDKP